MLQDLCRMSSGPSISRLKSTQGDPFRIIQVADLNSLDPEQELEIERLPIYHTPTVDPGDVLLSLRGSPIRAAVVPEGMLGCVASSNIAVLRLKQPKSDKYPDGLDPYYLAGLLGSEYMSQILAAYSGGEVVVSLSIRNLRILEVPVPPKKLQGYFAEAFKSQRKFSMNMQKLLALQAKSLEAELNLHFRREDD